MQIETVAGSILARSDATTSAAMLEPLLGTLLQVVGARHSTITAHVEGRNTSESPIPGSPETYPGTKLDGGVMSALDTTIIKLCGRIDSIVEDDKNWKTRLKQARELTEFDLSTRMQKLASAAEQTGAQFRPSIKFGRNLTYAVGPDGAAVVQLRVPGGVVIGTGKTFGDALSDFDSSFSGEAPIAMPDDYKLVAEESSAQPEKGEE